MNTQLIERLRNTPNWQRESYGDWKQGTVHYDRAPFEAADALEAQGLELAKARSAIRTLESLSYTNCGGEQWKPPIGKAPDFDLIDTARASFDELASAVGWTKERCEQTGDSPIDVAKALRAELEAIRAQQKDVVPQAWTSLLAYVLQDDMHNRLTPRVSDIAYTAFNLAKQPNTEDGGASDWFNDTKPTVAKMIEKLRKDLIEELPAPVASPDVGALVEAAQNAIGCFEAADTEGLVEALDETTDERLKDLVERRLRYAPEYLTGALSAIALTQSQAARVPDASPAAKDVGLVEAVDSVLERAPCDCSHKRRYEDGEHMSGCHLFDLNIARAAMLAASPKIGGV